jgi:hypothetical protein
MRKRSRCTSTSRTTGRCLRADVESRSRDLVALTMLPYIPFYGSLGRGPNPAGGRRCRLTFS